MSDVSGDTIDNDADDSKKNHTIIINFDWIEEPKDGIDDNEN